MLIKQRIIKEAGCGNLKLTLAYASNDPAQKFNIYPTTITSTALM